MAITDFDLWLDNNDLSDFNDVYALYHSVAGIDDWDRNVDIGIIPPDIDVDINKFDSNVLIFKN